MDENVFEKGLELFILQTALIGSIVSGMVVLFLSIVQSYAKSINNILSLKLHSEVWRISTILFIDIFLVITVIIGFLLLNPDGMADIKIAMPFYPIATILFAISLVLRIFYNGHNTTDPNFLKSLWIIFFANIFNIIGYSFIMKAPSGEYLTKHPSKFWTFIKSYLVSNGSMEGLEFSQVTFYVCFPILIAVFIWGFKSAIRELKIKNIA
ncbi:MAG: hypothetical protein PF445_04870 [Melioribacteraceae bacterium]|jgi:hypothetical protein|nr:hypothetical protein [Melioribacteraceae bacterium]